MTRHLFYAASVSFALLLAGCTTVGPDFAQPVSPAITKWQAADSKTMPPDAAEQIRWWESFGDPVIGKLVETAYRNNYGLKIAGLRVLEVRAQLGIAVGYLYPQVQQLNGNATWTTASKNAANTAAGDLGFNEYTVGAGLGWELDFWGKYRRAIESADAGLLASIAAYDNALVLLVESPVICRQIGGLLCYPEQTVSQADRTSAKADKFG